MLNVSKSRGCHSLERKNPKESEIACCPPQLSIMSKHGDKQFSLGLNEMPETAKPLCFEQDPNKKINKYGIISRDLSAPITLASKLFLLKYSKS